MSKKIATKEILLACLDISRDLMDDRALVLAEEVLANSRNTPRSSMKTGDEIRDTYILLGWSVPRNIEVLLMNSDRESMEELV